MSCPLVGNPPASYQWYFEKLQDDGSYSDRAPIQPANSLNITFLNNNQTLFGQFIEERNGYYSCYAENFLGNETMYFSPLRVHSK